MKLQYQHITFVVLLIFLCISCGNKVNPAKYTVIVEFQSARQAGDIDQMKVAVSKAVKVDVIKKDMSVDQIVSILGKPDHFTGIYMPDGISYGYGNIKPDTENYHKF